VESGLLFHVTRNRLMSVNTVIPMKRGTAALVAALPTRSKMDFLKAATTRRCV
jgi:hypothetical protein